MTSYSYMGIIILLIFFPGCINREWKYPPEGSFKWSIPTEIIDNNIVGILEENSSSNLIIGIIEGFDQNSEDKLSYKISSQINRSTNNTVNFFIIDFPHLIQPSPLNYESWNMNDSKYIDINITVTDDSPTKENSNFILTLIITNVNETPYFTNLGSIPVYADEYIDFSSNNIEWTDTDEGQNPSFLSEGPNWLNISNEGLFEGQPTTDDIGINSFLLNISDGEIDVQEELNIEVRANTAPVFTNLNSIPNSIRVGCYDDNDPILDINWIDPDNSSFQFTGTDIVTFNHQGTESVDWLNIDDENGLLFCVSKPENSDAAIIPLSISISDDRPIVSLSTQDDFNLELLVNDAPEFINLSNFPESLIAGDTLQFDLDWEDANNDIITFSIEETFSWFTWDNSGNITMNPNFNHIGTYDIIFNLNDGCYTSSLSRILIVE